MKTRATQKNRIILIRNGHQFIHTNIKLIQAAKKFILLHTYIFTEDEVTTPIINALSEAADRGVQVYILLDAFGSSDFPAQTVEKLKAHGVKFSFFTPLINLKKIGRRLHQKMLIIDNKIALTGGINLSQEFNNKYKPWLDFSCCIEGEEVHHLYQQSLQLYLSHFPLSKTELLGFNELKHLANDNVLVKTNVNDFFKNNQDIFTSYIKAISTARDEIIILATYFIPGKLMLNELKKAANRGVEIKLIFGKVSDQPLASIAEKYLYEWYIKNNIQIYEWGDSIIHGKLALIDSKWVTIGSYNHNYISRYGNLELNLEVFNKSFAKIVKNEFDMILSRSKKIQLDEFEFSTKSRLLSFLVYKLTNLITFLSIILLFRKSSESTDKLLK